MEQGSLRAALLTGVGCSTTAESDGLYCLPTLDLLVDPVIDSIVVPGIPVEDACLILHEVLWHCMMPSSLEVA